MLFLHGLLSIWLAFSSEETTDEGKLKKPMEYEEPNARKATKTEYRENEEINIPDNEIQQIEIKKRKIEQETELEKEEKELTELGSLLGTEFKENISVSDAEVKTFENYKLFKDTTVKNPALYEMCQQTASSTSEETVSEPNEVENIEQRNSEEDDETTRSDDQIQEEINKNLSESDPMARTFMDGATPAEIYEVFMDAIVYDPVMLDVYQQPDMKEIIDRVRPDFPYPIISDLVLKRFQHTEERLKSLLSGIETFFSIYLSKALFQSATYAIVEVAYFEDNGNRKTIALGCIRCLNNHNLSLHEDILKLIHNYNIENRCYNICGLSSEFDDVIDQIVHTLPYKNDRQLDEYLSNYEKFNESDMKKLELSIQKCQQMMTNLTIDLQALKTQRYDQQLATIVDQIKGIQNEQEKLETRIRHIQTEPDLISLYLTSRTHMDLLCVYELRKLTNFANELLVHLTKVNNSENEGANEPTDDENRADSSVILQSNLSAKNGCINYHKVLDSCAKVLNNDMSVLRTWATDHWNSNQTTRGVKNFGKFVERVMPGIEENLWIQVFLIQQWLPVLPNANMPSTSSSSSSLMG